MIKAWKEGMGKEKRKNIIEILKKLALYIHIKFYLERRRLLVVLNPV